MNMFRGICAIVLYIVCVEALEKRCSLGIPGSSELLIEIRSLDGSGARQIMAYGPNYEQGCKSSLMSVISNGVPVDIHSLEVLYDYSLSTQLTPDPNMEQCYVQAGNTPSEFGVTVVLQQQVGVIQLTDEFFIIFCNINDLDVGFKDVAPVDVSLNDVNPTIQPDRTEMFVIQLISNVNNNAVTEVNLGESVFLQMTYTKPSTVYGEWPIGVHNFMVTVRHENMAPGDAIILIDGDGCLIDDANANPFGFTDTFRWFAENADGTEFYFKTGNFKIAMLEGGNKLFIRGYYTAECFSKMENKCFNQQLYCQALLAGRTRRSTSPEVNGTYDLSVTVHSPGSSQRGTANDNMRRSCDAVDLFWIVSIVLGVLLLLVTCTALFLFCRLRMDRIRTKHDSRKLKKIATDRFMY